jgi:GH25 family lysozyme M1 (1,4-beta-N-acetylmuramidase)
MAPIRPHALCRRLALLAVLLVAILAFGGPEPAHGWSNGQAPGSALSQANTGFRCDGPGDQLANKAAAGWNTMALAAGKPLPSSGCDSLYRSYERQIFWRNYWCSRGACGNAAVPGTSNHGIGLAADVPQWVRGYIDTTGGAYGFHKPCSDAAHEWWHVKFCAGFDRPNPGTSLKYPVLRKGSGGPGQAAYVKRAQKRLRLHGQRSVTTDGDFGKVTKKAVNEFQRAHRLKPDGVIGRATWRALLRSPANNGGGGGKAPKPPDPKPDKPDHKLPAKPITGVDVSMHQGSIDWDRVRKDGQRFAIVKATEGEDYLDPWFTDDRLRAIERAGVVPGAYHFLRPRKGRTGAKEASWFTDQLLEAGYGKGWLPPVIDIEQTELWAGATCKYLRSAVTRIERNLDVEPIVYTYPSFAGESLHGCDWLEDYRLWIAHYGAAKPAVPPPWKRYLAHQFTDRGSVDGISGPVDVNRMPGGLRRLEQLRVGALPRKLTAEKRPRALAPRAVPAQELREKVPAAEATPLAEVAEPVGGAETSAEAIGDGH